MKNNIILYLTVILLLFSCSSYERYKENIKFYNSPELFHDSMQKLTDVIVYDIFSPPVASRIYAYPSIAAYEVLINDNLNYKSFAGQLNGLDPITKPDPNKEYSFPVASLHAFLTVGKDLIFSENKIESYQNELQEEFKKMGIPNDILMRSI